MLLLTFKAFLRQAKSTRDHVLLKNVAVLKMSQKGGQVSVWPALVPRGSSWLMCSAASHEGRRDDRLFSVACLQALGGTGENQDLEEQACLKGDVPAQCASVLPRP